MRTNHSLLILFFLLFLTASCRKTPLRPPSSPLDLKASPISNSKVLLEWRDDASDEDGFQIERRVGNGMFMKLGRTERDKSRFVDSGLARSTSYTYRVSSYNGAGISAEYSNEATATTWGPPGLTTAPPSDSTPGSAVSGGVVFNDGGSPVKVRGVVWSTEPAPKATLPTRTSDGSGMGAFQSRMTGLSPATKYHARSYAINSTDTAYGQEITFTTPQVDVYVVGSGWDGAKRTEALVWRNGLREVLPSENGGEAFGVWVKGRDLYVTGFRSNASHTRQSATLWKNGTPVGLDDDYPGITHSGATDVYISGEDIYVCGYLYNQPKNRYTAVVWKNGVRTLLTDTLYSSYAEAVTVSGSDVYVTGYWKTGSHNKAHYWKNGTAFALTSGIAFSEGFDIALSGTEVLVAGWESANPNDGITKPNAMVWRKGAPSPLSNVAKETKALSMFVENDDVHVVGYEYNGLYHSPRAWRNGNLSDIPLFNGSSGNPIALLRDVQLAFGDIYITGEKSVQGTMTAAVWKNGVETLLPNGARLAKANALWVTR